MCQRAVMMLRVLNRLLLSLLLSVPVATSAAAQTPTQAPSNVAVTGVIFEGELTRPVAGAVIESGTARAVAGTDGRFALALPLGPVRLRVTATGFLEQRLDVSVAAGMPVLEIALVRTPPVRE